MLTAASKYTLYRRQSLLLPATDLARMNAILTSNFVHRLLLLQSLQGYSPLGLRAVTFTFYCHRFPFVVWTFFILVSGPKFGEYHNMQLLNSLRWAKRTTRQFATTTAQISYTNSYY